MQITVVRVRRHLVEAPMPFVVRMKQNDVRLNAELLQVEDASLEVLEEFRIEPLCVEVARSAFKGIHRRLVGVPRVALGKNAEPDFVERRCREALERLL